MFSVSSQNFLDHFRSLYLLQFEFIFLGIDVQNQDFNRASSYCINVDVDVLEISSLIILRFHFHRDILLVAHNYSVISFVPTVSSTVIFNC